MPLRRYAAPALRSATTIIDVEAATAPSATQVLTATDSTHATWQTPSAGAGSALVYAFELDGNSDDEPVTASTINDPDWEYDVNSDVMPRQMFFEDWGGDLVPTSDNIWDYTTGSIIFAASDGHFSQDNNYFKWDSSAHIMRLGTGTTTFSNSGAIGSIIATMAPGNTFYVPYSGQNANSGTTASTDFVLGNDSASDTSNYSDFGINSSNNADPNYTLMGAGTVYWYSQSTNLIIATATAAKIIQFGTGGTLAANERMRITDTAVGIGTTSPNQGGYSGFTLTLGGGGTNIPVFEGIRAVTTNTSLAFLFRGGTTSNPALGSVEISSGAGNTDGQIDFKTSNAGASVATGFTIDSKQRTSTGGATPSAGLTLAAGTATAGFSPFKFTSGTNLTTAEAGAIEYDGSNIYFTPIGTIRKVIPTIITSRSTAQTAAVASVATQAVGATDSSFIVSANVLVTTSTVHSFTVTCAYTDEGNTVRTVTLSFSNLAGTFVTAIANAAGAVPYEGVPLHIRCKASTTITIATTGTFTTVTYNVEGNITKIA